MSAPTPHSSTGGVVNAEPWARPASHVKDAAQKTRGAIYALIAVLGGLL
jgi:hypothetical protein